MAAKRSGGYEVESNLSKDGKASARAIAA